MNEVLDLLARLRKLDIKLELDGEKLKINAPKGALNDELKLELKEQKEAIIAFIKEVDKRSQDQELDIPKLSAEQRANGVPASDSQARFWFLDQFSPADPSFNIPAAVEIRGDLDVPMLEKSIQYLIQRHDALRTAFIAKDGQPQLSIIEELDWTLEHKVLEANSNEEMDQALALELDEVLAKGFDLSQAPLLRIRLLELNENFKKDDTRKKYVLLNCIHHIVCDGWSIDIILREMTQIYLGFMQGAIDPLPALDINFSDYAHWQAQSEQKEKLEHLLEHWKTELEGAKGLLSFPYDRPRPVKPLMAGATYNFSLDQTLSKQVETYCQAQGLTPFMFFMAIYQIALAKYSAEDDISVGIPIAGRTQQAIEGIVGLFLNALIIRGKPQAQKSIQDYFEEVKNNTLSAFDKQDLALDTLIDALDIDRENDEVPGVQFGFIFQNAQERARELPSYESDILSLKPLTYENKTSKHDMCLTLGELDGRILASIEYKSSLLDQESVEAFSEHFISLCTQVLEKLDQKDVHTLSELSLFSKQELSKSLGLDANDIEAISALSESQKGFYFNDLIRVDNESSLIGTSILVQGDFDIDRWQQSLQLLSDNRSALRIQLYPCDEKLLEPVYQVITTRQEIDFAIEKAPQGGWNFESAQQKAKELIYTPFALHKSPLIRHRVFVLNEQAGEQKYLLVTSMHHILMDAVSALQHWKEAQALYEAMGDVSVLQKDNYLSYLDFSQRTINSRPVTQHWQQELLNVDAPDYAVHGKKSYQTLHPQGERQLKRLMVEGEQWQAVKQYCRKQGITPAIFYKVLFGFMVERYCQPDESFYIHEIITGRPKDYLITTANCFLIQPFTFEADAFSGEAIVADAFKQAKLQQKRNRDYAYISQQALNNLRPPGRVAFYYNYLTFIPPEDFLGNAVEFRDWGNEIDDAVEFNPRLGPDGLELNLFYREGLFREQGFLQSLQFIVEQLVAGEQSFAELQYQNDIEQAACLYEMPLAKEPAADSTVVSLFLEHVKSQPNRQALRCQESNWTYAELEQHSASVAAYLSEQGITQGALVVLEQSKSLEALAGVLGVLRAGAQYLPLDASLPEDRRAYIIEDSAAAIVLDQSKITELIATPQSFDDLILSQDLAAYTIYTSGSTGQPKGVQVNHGPLLNTYFAWEKAFALSAEDHHLQMASFGFDVFTGDWVRALCSGASMCLLNKDELLNPEHIHNIIETQKVTIAEFVPAVLRSVLQFKSERLKASEQERPINMRMLIVGSDAWFESDHALAASCVKEDCILVNSYGVTEAVIDSSYSQITAGEFLAQSANAKASVSIGLPLANTGLYVLDENQHLLPKEVAGELYIAGPDLAEGYVSQGRIDQEKTEQAFLPNTIWSEGNGRMYRTGDRAKLSQDNELLLLGRIGQQVKVRGFRIELGEIENQIAAISSVEECLVLAVENEAIGDKALVAYVVFKQGSSLSSTELRQVLAKHLPDYMLPQLSIALDKIPLNANGKLDRKALPEPDFSQSQKEAFVAPRNEIEQNLADIWSAVLGLEQIGVNDNFFELGGHSLLATQLASRVKSDFDRELSIKSIFEKPTIAELAQEISLLLSKDQSLSAPEIVAVERQELMPVSYSQQRFWFLDKLLPGFFAYNMPFGIKLKGDFKPEVFKDVLTEISARHELLRCHFVSEGDRVKASIDNSTEFPLLIERIEESDPDKRQVLIEERIQENAHKPFDLAKDQLIRCQIIQSDENEHLLLGCMHHIISDGWSVRILFAEIALLYNAFVQGRPSPLPNLSLQYLDYAHWEQSWMQGEVLDRYTDFWLKELEGAPEILRLPCDKERPPAQTFNGKQISVLKDAAFRQKLERFSQSQGVSLFMSLMAAMSILMSRYSKEKDILIGTPVAGRDKLATEGIIGLFLNAVIIRNRLEHNPSVSELLQQVKESSLGAFAHQEMPAEILYEKVANHRNPQYPAGAQVGLVLQNTANQQSEVNASQFGDHLQGLSAELIGTQQVISNYDFGFTIIEQVELDKSGSSTGGLQIIAEFNTDLFFDSTIERMLDQYVLILDSMMSNPSVAVENINLVPQKNLLQELAPELGGEGSDEFQRYSSALPLTAMQESMYMANRLNPYSKEYGVGFSVRMRLALDVDLWTSSLQGLIDSQEVARIVFHECQRPDLDEAYQLVLKQKSAKVELLDWTVDAPEDTSEEAIEALASQFINAPYNVLKDDLMRVMLIKVSDDYFVGVFGAHHILMDGIAVVAFGVMGAMNYEIVSNGGQAIVHEDKYKEYLLENTAAMDTADIRNFWQERLQGREQALEALNYPVQSELLYDLQNPPKKSKKSLSLDPMHWEAVKMYCKQQRITPALYFKGLYALVLNRYCLNEDDFYIFEILAGRPAGHMNALGCYFQQIPVLLNQDNFSAEASVKQLFKSLRMEQKASKNKHLISVPLQLSMLPEAPVSFMYNFEHYIPDFYFMGQPVEIQEYSNQVNGIVQFLVKTLSDSVQLNLQSQENFFDDFNLLERIERLSQAIVAGADSLADLKILNEQEQALQLEQWNKPAKIIEDGPCVHQLFEKAALEFPDKVASSDASGAYTYIELNEKANQLAHHLKAQGIGSGDTVGICLPLCKEVPLALMAIIKTGAAYLPMDSRYPDERLHYFIEDSKPKLVLSVPHLIARLATKESEQALYYSVFDDVHQELPGTNLDLAVSSNELLYVLYTSGSTGRPNCTATYHRSEHNLIDWYCGHFEMSAQDKVLVISALGFDLTQKNLMAPLTCGAQIVFHDKEIYDDAAIRPLIKEEAITWMNCAPSAFYPLVENAEEQELNTLRWVFLGGEPIAMERLSHWYTNSQCKLVNSYGPSECTDISSYHIVERKIVEAGEFELPIGSANDNVNLYVLNKQQSLMPVGLPGELYVGGASVGPGYLNNPELSAERFIDNPFGEGKLYKTGDLVKYRDDGEIIYIGRSDFQIKVRGVRIEPGEIEARIKDTEGVQDALVLLDTQERLVAYVVSEHFSASPLVLTERLESELRNYLSNAMQPSHYVILDKFPLSPNGKVDRKALPEPQALQREYVAPVTENEIILAEIWQNVLKLDRVSRYDNFFDIGGQSLIAVQLIAQINQAFDINAPLAILFEAQTLDMLAIKVDSFSKGEWQALVPIQTTGEKSLFCMHPLGGEILSYRDFARAMGDEFSVYGVQSSGMMDGQDVIDDLDVMCKRYVDEMEAVTPSGEYYLAGRSIGGVLGFAIAQELEARGHKVVQLILFDSFIPTEENLEMLGLEHMRAALGAFIQIEEDQLKALGEIDQLEGLFEQAKAAYLIPQEIEFSQIRNHYLVSQANIKLTQATAIEMAKQKASFPVLHIEAEYSLGGRPSTPGWEDYAEKLEYFKVVGNHENMMLPPNIDLIAEEIKGRS